MSITAEQKREIVSQFGKYSSDTGKTEVQVALLTHRINHLTEHRRFLNYLQNNDLEGYRSLIRELGLRR